MSNFIRGLSFRHGSPCTHGWSRATAACHTARKSTRASRAVSTRPGPFAAGSWAFGPFDASPDQRVSAFARTGPHPSTNRWCRDRRCWQSQILRNISAVLLVRKLVKCPRNSCTAFALNWLRNERLKLEEITCISFFDIPRILIN